MAIIQCVQIQVGYYEVDREALIAFLKENKECLDVICIRRSRCEGEKAVQVYTAEGKKLVDYITKNYPSSRDFAYK